jgi:hypothetical protein
VYDVRPEKARGWELATEGRIENYRKHLANDVTVTAIWDGDTDVTESTADVEVPDVSDVQSPPDTLHDLVPLLEARFGVTEDNLMIKADSSALIVVGEPAVSSLIERGKELHKAVRPRWYPALADRPGEQWVVLRRVGVH